MQINFILAISLMKKQRLLDISDEYVSFLVEGDDDVLTLNVCALDKEGVGGPGDVEIEDGAALQEFLLKL